jgi:hypothetical protein
MPKKRATKPRQAIASKVAVDDPVAVARAEVERLNAQELKFASLVREGSAALADIRAKRGRQVLDANDPSGAAGAINQRIRAAEDELAAMMEAAAEARRARLPAIAAVIAAEAEAKVRRAEQLEAEAAKLEAESNRLRAALEQHDDWAYFPAEGNIDGHYLPAVAHGGGEFRVIDARGPRHARLRAEAQGLRTQAAQGRFRKPHQAGSVEADGLEGLLGAVYSDPMRIGPLADAIAAWSEQAREKEQRRRARMVGGDGFLPAADVRYHLEWRNGAIDAAQSRIVQREPSAVSDHFDSEVGFEKLVAAQVEDA